MEFLKTEEQGVLKKFIGSTMGEFFDISNELLCISAMNGNLIKVNRQFCTVTGYSANELAGRNAKDFIHEEDWEQTVLALEKSIEGYNNPKFTNRHICKNGEYRHLEWNCIRRDDYIYCAARDVTEYYVEQEVLRQMVACSTRAMKKDSSEIDFKAICRDMSIISQSPLVILLTQKEGEFAFEALACSKDMPQEVEEYLRDKNSFTGIEQKAYSENSDAVRIMPLNRLCGETGCAEAIIWIRNELKGLGIITVRMDGEEGCLGEFILVSPTESFPLRREYVELFCHQVTIMLERRKDAVTLKNTMKQLKRNKEIYQGMVEGMDLGLVRFEPVYDNEGNPIDHRFLSANSGWIKMMDVNFDEMIGKTSREIPKIVGPGFLAEYADIARNGGIIEKEEYFPNVDKYIHYRVYSPIANQFAIIAEDVTERYLERNALEDTRIRLQIAAEGTNVLIWDWDLATNEISYSEQLETVFGYDEKCMENFVWVKHVHDEDIARVMQAINDYKDGVSDGFHAAFRYRHADGHWLWVASGGKFLRDEAGKPIRFIGTTLDISHVKQIEEALQESEEKFKSIFDNLPTALFLFEPNAYLLEANAAALKMYGVASCKELNESDLLWQAEGFDLKAGLALAESVAKNGPRQAEWCSKDPQGNIRHTLLHITALNLQGKQMMLVASVDMTERKRIEKEKEEYRLKLSAVNKRQSVMMSVVAEFAKATADDLASSITAGLALITKLVKADRISVCKYDFDRSVVIIVGEWCAEGIDSQMDFLREAPLGYSEEWLEKHRKGQAVIINSVPDMSKQSLTRQVLMLQGTKSTLRVPLLRDENLVGFIGVHSIREQHEYTYEDVQIISEFGNELVNTIVQTALDKQIQESEERFRKLFANIPSVAVTGYDEYRRPIYCNTAAAALYGYENKEDIAKQIFDYGLHDGKADEIKLNFGEILNSDETGNIYEVVRRNQKGDYITVLSSSTVLTLSNNKREVYIVDIDLSRQKELEAVLQQEKEMMQKTLMSIGDGMILTDLRGQVKMMNGVAERLCGFSQDEAMGCMLEEIFNVIDEGTRAPIRNPVVVAVVKNDAVTLEQDIILVTKDYCEYSIEMTASPIRDHNEKITGVIIVFRDSTEKKAKQQEVEFLSFNDYLTGMYNRRYVDRVIEEMDTPDNYPLTLVYLDLNGLKLINDAFGHSAGDEVLKTVANILKSATRPQDVIGRIGGDEFIMVLPATDGVYTEEMLARINKTCENVKLDSALVSLASGFASKVSAGKRLEAVKREAENAMYNDKVKRGRNVRMATIETVVRNINLKFDYEQMHTERVAQLSEITAKIMGLHDKQIEDLKIAANLHDIGKIAIDPAILRKPGKLDEYERRAMEKHSEIGYQILKSVDEYVHIANYVLHHHERWDGKGYPQGLAGADIPLLSRIICVADAFEAMTSMREYQVRRSASSAIEELQRCAGKQFDPEVVEAFVTAFSHSDAGQADLN